MSIINDIIEAIADGTKLALVVAIFFLTMATVAIGIGAILHW